jgi:hypothetical protein
MIIIRFVVIAILLFVIITVVSFVYLPWWQALLIALALIAAFFVGLRFIIKSFMDNLGKSMLGMFEVKARVLRGATAEVHAVEAVPRPPAEVVNQDGEDADDDDDDDEEDERDLAYYRIDFTLRPAATDGPMTHWDLDDLCVADVSAKPISLDPKSETDPGEGFHFEQVQVYDGGKFQPDDQGKYAGQKRLNVIVGVPPELRELKFRYYTEDFGRIVLPAPLPLP